MPLVDAYYEMEEDGACIWVHTMGMVASSSSTALAVGKNCKCCCNATRGGKRVGAEEPNGGWLKDWIDSTREKLCCRTWFLGTVS